MGFNGGLMGVTRPSKRLQKTNWKDPPLLMLQSTISTGQFSSSLCSMFTRPGTLW